MSAAEWQAMSDAAHRTAGQFDWQRSTDVFEAELSRVIAASRDAKPLTAVA
jgi:hypothetical protein